MTVTGCIHIRTLIRGKLVQLQKDFSFIDCIKYKAPCYVFYLEKQHRCPFVSSTSHSTNGSLFAR